MADKGSKGTTVTIGGADVGTLRNVDFGNTGAKVRTTGLADAIAKYVIGSKDQEVTLGVVGANDGYDVGDTGALVITFNDGATETLGDFVVDKITRGAGEDTEIESSIGLVPYGGT